MPSMFRGLLTAGLIAILTLCCAATAQAGSVRLVRGSTEATSRPSWAPGAWVHQHAYGLDAAELAAHPEWQLKDAGHAPLFIGTRAAADFGNAAFRAWWIEKARTAVAGYRGLFIDDVLMERRTTNAGGAARTPVDPRTGATMSEASWQRYLADFMVAVRAALPTTEIVHDVLWHKGDAGHVLRGLQAANLVSVDGGFNGPLTSGTGTYGFQTLAGWAEREQARGGAVIFDHANREPLARLYGLAGYLLVSNGASAIANDTLTKPNDFWTAYDVDLGAPLGTRYQSAAGAWRRDYAKGIVIAVEPYRAARTFTLPAGYQDLDGIERDAVTLAGGQGAVLVPMPPKPVPTPTPTSISGEPASAPISTAPVTPSPVPVAPVTPTAPITTVSTGGDRARIARTGGTAGAKDPEATRVSVRGSRTRLAGRVKGAVAGYVRVTIERRRGVQWAVVRRVKVAVKRNGRFAKDIPTLPGGSYRVSGFFEGTGTAKPARSGYSTFG